MDKEKILNTFLLANIPEIITQEEFDDVKKTIRELQQENKQLKDNWNKLKEYCKENTLCYEVGDDENTKLIGSKIHGLNVLDKMQELEQGSDSNEIRT